MKGGFFYKGHGRGTTGDSQFKGTKFRRRVSSFRRKHAPVCLKQGPESNGFFFARADESQQNSNATGGKTEYGFTPFFVENQQSAFSPRLPSPKAIYFFGLRIAWATIYLCEHKGIAPTMGIGRGGLTTDNLRNSTVAFSPLTSYLLPKKKG